MEKLDEIYVRKCMATLKECLTQIRDVWHEDDQINNWISVYWLVQKQLDEIKEKHFEANCFLQEMTDILIVILRYLDKIGIDPSLLVLHRLNTRHRGKTKEIVQKYQKMFEEEQNRR